MIGFLKYPRRGLVRGFVTVPAGLLTVLALALSGCTSPPRAPDAVVTASLPDGVEASVVFPGHSDVVAAVEPIAITEEMAIAVPGASAHLAGPAEFTVAEGEFPESGAEVSFARTTAAPLGAFSVIVHWNEESKEWEPVQTRQSDDLLTLTATVEHFSIYSVMDFFRDVNAIYQGGRAQADGFAAEHDPEAIHRIINGTGQWFGAQVAQPDCGGGTSRPDWAETIAQSSITNIVTSCVTTSGERHENLMVKVTVNRSYAGYFHTEATPLSATQTGFGEADESTVGDVVKDTWDDGYLDWKAVGAMLVNSDLIARDGDASDLGKNVYPAMPFATYTFEFTEEEVMQAWPDIEAQNKKLITFDTDGKFALTGFINGAVDATVVIDNGKKLGFIITLIQINDCFRTFNETATDSEEGSGDQYAAALNCASLMTPEKTESLVKKSGLNLRFKGKPLDRDFFEPAAKGVRKIFAFISGVQIGASIGTALNDLSATELDDRSVFIEPAGAAVHTFAAAPWERYITPDRRHSFLIPERWDVVPGKPIEGVTGQNLDVVNEKGQVMSSYRTGFPQPQGLGMMAGMKERTNNIDTDSVEGLEPILDTTENYFHFGSVNFDGDAWNASIGVHSFLKSDADYFWTRGFDIKKGDPLPIGGVFGRSINDDTELPDIDPTWKGNLKYEAYLDTSEYQLIKKMLTSLSDNGQ